MKPFPALVVVLGGVLVAGASAASPLDLPVWRPGQPLLELPAYRGDQISLQLTSTASRLAYARLSPPGFSSSRPARATSVGLASLDRLAAALGGATFEPEFVGESPLAVATASVFCSFFIVTLPPGTDLATALARFRDTPDVLRASPIPIVATSATQAPLPNDSLATGEGAWWIDQPSDHDVDALEAWSLTTGDRSMIVAILDTGVIPYHPDIGGRGPHEPSHIWSNTPEASGVPGVDDDGNGFIDDIAGWDFVKLPTNDGVAPGEDGTEEDNDPNDFVGHGTAVAGVVGAITNNQIGIAAIAPEVSLMPLRVGFSTVDRPGGIIDMAYLAQAVRYATRMGANVINLSTSTVALVDLQLAVIDAVSAGVVVVNAAGNNDSPDDIGRYEGVITV